VSGPLDRREPGELASQVREATTWLVDLLFERTDDAPAAATAAPIAARRCRLAAGRRIGFVSLVAGCGTTTTAALVAQRSGGAGSAVRLLDLDLEAPTVALLAGERTPTLLDALGASEVRGRRWGSANVVFGAERDPGPDVAPSLARLVRTMARDAAVVVDAGTLSAASVTALGACDAVLYVTTPRAAHVHAALRAIEALAPFGAAARLVVARATHDEAASVAREIGLTLAGSLPEDPFLARDEFRIRAETARAVDLLCESLG